MHLQPAVTQLRNGVWAHALRLRPVATALSQTAWGWALAEPALRATYGAQAGAWVVICVQHILIRAVCGEKRARGGGTAGYSTTSTPHNNHFD